MAHNIDLAQPQVKLFVGHLPIPRLTILLPTSTP
jgi:hypothetical protein